MVALSKKKTVAAVFKILLVDKLDKRQQSKIRRKGSI